MRTRKTTRASFSAETNTVNISLPKSWAELTNAELEAVYRLMELYDSQDVRFPIFRHLSGLAIGRRKPDKDGRFFCAISAAHGNDSKNRTIYESHVFWLSGLDLAAWLDELNWIYEPGSEPVRVNRLRNADALHPRLYGVSFDTYLQMENLYQGFLQSQDVAALSALYRLLYPGVDEWQDLSPSEITNLLQWVVQLKSFFSRQFTNLFKPGGKGNPDMLEVMNNEIRALTGGDVTKEQQVLDTDCWRALTELDFKAKEAEDFRREQAKIKKH